MKKTYSIYLFIREFLNKSKKQLIVTAILTILGIIIGVILYNNDEDIEVFESSTRLIVKTLIIIVPSYLMVLLSGYKKIFSILSYVSFIFIGVMSGCIIDFLWNNSFLGIINIIFVTIPICFLTYITLNYLIYLIFPYLTASPNSGKIPNCYKGNTTIIKSTFILLTINISVVSIYIWIVDLIFKIIIF